MTGEAAEASWQIHRQRDGVGTVRIYRKNLSRRILLTINSLVGIPALLATIGLLLLRNDGPLPLNKIAGCLALAGIALGLLWLLVLELTYKIMLTDDVIAASRWGWKRELARAEIAGRRQTRVGRHRWLTIVPIDPQAKPLRLPSGFATDSFFESWIAGLRDLNAEDLKASEAAIAGDPHYGITPQERLERLARARTTMKWVNIGAIVVAAWCLLAPLPYLAAIGAAAFYPVLGAIMVATSGGLVRFGRLTTDAHAGASAGPVFCAVALALRIYWDVYLVDWGSALIVGGFVGFVLLALAAILDRSLTRHILVLGIAAFVALVYGIAVLMFADVHLDRSQVEKFQSRILASRVSRGRATSYFVRLAPWGPQQRADELLVSETLFNRLVPGRFACIGLYDGALAIRWFSIDPCPTAASNAPGPFDKFKQYPSGTYPFGPAPGLMSPR